MLSLANMRALVAVVEEGSFTRAAERLNATQSGVSQQIASLERGLNVALLDRRPAGAVPTPAGRALYRRSVAVLEEAAHAEAEAKSYSGSLTGSIRLGLMPALTRSLMGPVLRRFMAAHPNLTITAIEAVSTDLVERAKADELDVAVVPVFDAPPSLRCRAVGNSPEVLVGRGRRHPQHMKPVSLTSLGSLKLILQSPGNMRRERILGHLRARGIEISSLMDLDSMFGTLEFVGASDYVTVLPSIMVTPEIETGDLCVRPIKDEDFMLEMMAIEPKRRGSNIAVSSLIDALTAELGRSGRPHRQRKPAR
jgi:LysR family transcriptional regulator, nitrogen assimilation regulatory protein